MDLFCLTQKRPVTQEIEGKYGSAPPLPGQCLRASKKALYTLEINAMSRWDAPTFWFSKSWGATGNTNNKPNGNVFALPCFELFHRWPAILDVSLPGWQLLQVFNSRMVQYRHFVKQSWYTKSNQVPIRWSWSSLELTCLMMPNHPNLKFLGWFSNIHYESSLAKSQVFFDKRIWGAFTSTIATS